MSLKSIEEFQLAGKKVFIRVDFNVALSKFVPGENLPVTITDDTRIREALPTIQYARQHEAKLILASHLGRPDGKVDPHYSLLPVAERLSDLLDCEVIFPENCIGDGPRKIIREMKPGQVVLLENLRFHKGETKNDPEFAAKLAEFCDIFINDAFGTMHRAHASTAALPQMVKDRGIGFLVQKEMKYLSKLLTNPEHPFLAILGGNKISDKISVIRELLPRLDTLLVVGGMAYTFLKEQGVEIGKSVVENDRLDVARDLQALAKNEHVKLLLPTDHVLADRFDSKAKTRIAKNGEISSEWMGLDIGPETIARYVQEISKAKTIFWNGPAGVYEMEIFRKGTLAIAQALAESQATTVVAGGDSVAAVKELKLEDKMTLISTGGGATLEFVGGKSLPGIQSVEVLEVGDNS